MTFATGGLDFLANDLLGGADDYIKRSFGGAEEEAAKIQAKSAERAGEQRLLSTREMIDMLESQYLQGRQDMSPYRNTGYGALGMQAAMLGLGSPAQNPYSDQMPEIYQTRRQREAQERLMEDQYRQRALDEIDHWNDYVRSGEGDPRLTLIEGKDRNRRLQELMTQYRDQDFLSGPAGTGQGFGGPEMRPPENLGFEFSHEDFRKSPGYQFQLDEMQRALDAKNSATGNFYSGGAMRELARYTAGLADQEFSDAYNREYGKYTDYYNRLAGLSGTGQVASTNTATLGQQSTGQAAGILNEGSSDYQNALMNAAASRASGVLGKTQAQTDTIMDIGEIVGKFFGGGGFGG